jgi:protein-disulfide isomerase
MSSQPPRKSPQPLSRRQRRELARAQSPRVRSRAAVRRPAWQSPLALVSLASVLAVVLLIVLLQRPGSTDDELIPPPANVAAETLAEGSDLGSAAAPVQLEIWADFQCPVCASLVKDYMPQLIRDFVVPGQVRIVSHDIAILGSGADDESLAAAVGARCAARQDRYWSFHDWLYYNQRGENRGAFSAERLAAIADAAGVDRAAWEACTAEPGEAAAIRKNTSDAVAAGINATPSFRFGGQVVTGLPRSYAELADALRAALEATPPDGQSPGASG